MNKQELIADIEANNVTQKVVTQQPYSFVELCYTYNNFVHIGYGFSKVCHPDEWDADFGLFKARQRAVSNVYQQIKSEKHK